MKTFKHDNINYQISSFSGANHTCVGVSIQNDDKKVSIINTNAPNQVLEFTYDEWNAFVCGVKADEFKIE